MAEFGNELPVYVRFLGKLARNQGSEVKERHICVFIIFIWYLCVCGESIQNIQGT